MGENETKNYYSKDNYKYYDSATNTYTKYNFLYGYPRDDWELDDDPARTLWGENWQIPSRAQFEELSNDKYTEKTWTTLNDVPVIQFTSKRNSKSICMPFSGFKNGANASFSGSEGDYWTRTAGVDFHITLSSVGFARDTYYFGLPIRPVRKQ